MLYNAHKALKCIFIVDIYPLAGFHDGLDREFNQCVPSPAVITPLLSLKAIVTECAPFKGTFNVCWDKGVDRSFHLSLSGDSCTQGADPFHTDHLVLHRKGPIDTAKKHCLYTVIMKSI